MMNFFRMLLDETSRDLLDSKVLAYHHGRTILTESVGMADFFLFPV